MKQVQHFSSIIPCKMSESSNSIPVSCTIALEFTKSNLQFNIFPDKSKDIATIQFKYDKYTKLLVSESRCIFINTEEDIFTIFFFFCCDSDGYANNDLRRFVFALADAGMLIPDNCESYLVSQNSYFHFHFVPAISFIPDGFYNFTNHLIRKNVRKILITRIQSIQSKKDYPLNPNFFNLAFGYLSVIENQKILLAKDKNAINYSLNFVLQHHFKILTRVLSKFYNQESYNKFKKEIRKVDDDPKYSSYFDMIDSDCREFNSDISNIYNRSPSQIISQIYKDKWNTKLSNICMNVCKVNVISQNIPYFENNFIIAMKIALLLRNGVILDNLAEFSPNGKNKKDIETFSKSIQSLISEKNNEEFEAIVFTIYSTLMNGLTKKVMSNYGFDFCMKVMSYAAPSSHAYFILAKIESFFWLEKDLKELFLFTTNCPWIFWFFILRASNSEMAIQSLIASIVYHFVPQLINRNINDKKAIADFWPDFIKSLKDDVDLIKNIIDFASFFHKYHGTP